MQRRCGQQRVERSQLQGRRPHEHGDPLPIRPSLHGAGNHLDHPLPLQSQRPPRGQVQPLRQHHGQARQGLRQQIPRVHEGDQFHRFSAHRQGDPFEAASLKAPVHQIADAPDQQRQEAQPIYGRPQGHRAQVHPLHRSRAAPGQQNHPAPQQQRGRRQGQKRPEVFPSAHEQRRHQQARRPPRQAQQPGAPAQGQRVPNRPQEREQRRPAGPDRHAAQGPGQLQQQKVHPHVVQQKPLQGDPHATSMTMTVMSSRCPLRRAASISDAAICSRGASWSRFSSVSSSFPKRS